MLEWVLVIVTVFNMIFNGYINVPQTQVRNYPTQNPQAMGNPYWTQGTQGYYYGQPPQTVAYPQGY